MRSRFLATVLVLALTPSVAVAADGSVDMEDMDITTTRDLYNLCAAKPNDPLVLEAAFLCLGFVAGVVNYHTAVTKPGTEPMSCAPAGTTRQQFVDKFVAWGQANDANAELMSELAVNGMARTAMEAWPCK